MTIDNSNTSERGNYNLMVRLTKTQHTRIKNLAEASGFKTISNYVRTQLLNPSMEMKLNQILTLLQEKKKFKENRK